MSDDLELWQFARPADERGVLFPGDSAPPPMLVTRDYQEDALQALRAARAAGQRRAAMVMATGAGKTVVFCQAAKEWSPGRTLILTDQTDLIEQAVERLRESTGIIADVEQGDKRASRRAQVVVATVQTLANRLSWWDPNHFDLIVADECDRAMSATWQKVLAHFDRKAFALGVTATPKRTDRKSILSYFERIIARVPMTTLIERGYLVPIRVEHEPLEIDIRGVKTTAGDYDAQQVGERLEMAFTQIVRAWKKRAGHLRSLFFLPDIRTSRKFVEVAIAEGVNARHIDSTLRDRRQLKAGFREDRFRLLSNPMLLGRGFDDPGIQCVVNLRATKSLSLYQQICGRGTRLFCPHGCRNGCEHEDRKRELLLLDFLWQFDDMGPLGPGALLAEDEERQELINRVIREHGQMDLIAAAEEAERRAEEAILKALAEAQKGAGAGKKLYFHIRQWAASMRLHHLIDYLPETPEDAAPPTPKQLRDLADKGFFPQEIDSAGLAREILKICKARSKAGLASFKQIYWLIKKGARNVEGLTCAQAGALLNRAFRGEDLRKIPEQPELEVDDHGIVDLGPEHDDEADALIAEIRARKRGQPPGYEFDQPF